MAEKIFDVVVIGSGVIGHSIAFRLKRSRPELSVAVLGDAINSLTASRAAAGMLAPFGESEEDNRFFRFCRESLEKYPKFVEELVGISGVPVFLSNSGSIMPDLSLEGQWEDRLKFFREHDVPHEIWDGQRLLEKVPHLSPECKRVVWVGEGQVNNRQLHDSLQAASMKLGVETVPRNALGFQRDGSILGSATTDSGEVAGKKFILASGSWSAQLAAVLDVNLPVKPVKGQMCRLKVADDVLDYTVHGLLTYIAPWRGGQGFVVGSTMEDRGFDPAIEDEVIRGLIERAAEILPCLKDAPLIESWTGLRPAAQDRMPVMGKSGRYKNLFYSTGHYRNGILQTPNQADYVAGLVLETGDEVIDEFDPKRYDL